ncbi:hybrid sensor histidine kinase/response regulator [Cesiribacter andamanensis]|uniref:histidine kinase n=1 Tax=Cesiribacter andamanensis AMV16 TaxID=1279009 RepID=M7N9M4_9BACT|nr:response regulator [Cesiribacter andamanensis]EMR03972.1 Non-motile and phage-resistance protein [Cesiribacter andamanensis AMV16]
MPHSVLIVEDEVIAALSLQETLHQLGYSVCGLASGSEEALQAVRQQQPDLVLMDINLGEQQDGIQLGQTIMQAYGLPVVFLTAYSDRGTIERAKEAFPYGYMIKPWQEAELLATLETALYKHLADKRQFELQQTRNKFYTIIGHDLRSPLAALSVSTRALLKHLDALSPDDLREFISDIHHTVENLYAFTDNLLEWSRLQSGRLEYRPQAVAVQPLAEEVLALLESHARNKGVQVRLQAAARLQVQADRNMLHTILLNLLSNAIKFSYPGSEVWLEVSRQDAARLELQVRDRGRGIPAQQLASLFDFKTAIHTPGTQEEKGTGLGLLLTKEFVEAHGSRLEVSSQEGVGTCIRFFLPLIT